MKHAIIGAALAALSTALHAQTFTPSSGWTATKLFETGAGETIGGLEFDTAGNVYYLVGSSAAPTQLVRRSPVDAYAAPTTLFTFGGPVFGSFVRENAGRLFFGENSAGTIRTYELATTALALLATVGGNYDLDFSGGAGWLSANPGFAGNKILKLNLTTGATTDVLTSSDFSGPVALDAAGNLYYGGTGFGVGGGIYRYTAAEAAAGGLTLDAAHQWVSNASGSAYFDMDPALGLFQTDFAAVNLIELATGGFSSVGTSPHTVGQLASAGGAVAVSVTDYASFATSADDRSAVFRVVPEPATAMLAAFGITALALRRRRA